jgi:hypothetical protein
MMMLLLFVRGIGMGTPRGFYPSRETALTLALSRRERD